jgi:outer membrane protein OmpA-like peptidoglycan-associated protein
MAVAAKIGIDCGLALFDQHDAGIKIGQDGAALLAEAARALKDIPLWIVVLEGHCPGKPQENSDFKKSIGEEAADLCKAYLQGAGVANKILCEGLGCQSGLGMCVQMSTREPEKESPIASTTILSDTQTLEGAERRERAETEPQQVSLERCETMGHTLRVETPTLKSEPESPMAQPRTMRAESEGLGTVAATPAVDVDDFVGTVTRSMTQDVGDDGGFHVPDTSNLSPEDKRKAMNQLLDKALETNIAFEPNKAEVSQRSHKTVKQIAKVLAAFPTFPAKCVGHSKGRPAENNDAKRQLAKARAEAVKELLAGGAQNEIICASYGSALGRGMCVRVHALTPEEVADGEIRIHDCSDLTKEQQETSLNQLLQEALAQGLAFEPNKATIHENGVPVIRKIANILKAFPGFIVRCEGHAKGQASDNNDAKRRLSQVRAEAVRASVQALGATNPIVCIGIGSAQELGMCVQMFVTDPDKEIKIPETAGMSEDEKGKLLNSLLGKALETNIEFEPNKSDIPPAGHVTIRALALVLMNFPEFTLCCEGHTKGLPAENSDAKRKLSHARAESVKSAVAALGVTNKITCRGAGAAQGCGLCVKMFVIDPEELKKDAIVVPDKTGMTKEEEAKLLDELLEAALQKNIEFEPNVFDIPSTGMDTIHAIAHVLQQFPDFAIRCEGHAKGQPSDNSEAKKKLSCMRAEAVKAGVKQEGVKNGIHCVGEGCAQGRGMRVRMFVIDPEELKKNDVVIPEQKGQSREERAKTLNELLAKALERSINFEPNKADIQAAGMDVIDQLTRVLKAFSEFTVHCEGHAKGKPADNNEAKRKLSQARADAVSTALKKNGVENEIICSGCGSEQGLGMCVRMFTPVSS